MEKAKYTFSVESLSHCNEVDYVLACHPDRKRLNSCLGSDQLLVSAINNELSGVDTISAWNDICWILTNKDLFGALYDGLQERFDKTCRDGF